MSAISNHAFLRLGPFRVRRFSHLPPSSGWFCSFWPPFLTPVWSSGRYFLRIVWKMFANTNYRASDLGFYDTANKRTHDHGFKTAQKILLTHRSPHRRFAGAHFGAHRSPHDSHETRFRIRQQPKAKPSRPCNPQPGNRTANLRCSAAKPTLSPQGSQPLPARPRQGFRKTTASNC